jgi:hypothetical protein
MANWILVLIAGWALGHLWPRGWLKAMLAWRASVEERWAGGGAPAPEPAPAPAQTEEPTGEQVAVALQRMRRTPQDLERVTEALREVALELKQKRGE